MFKGFIKIGGNQAELDPKKRIKKQGKGGFCKFLKKE